MDKDRLLQEACERWDFPLGPFLSPEEAPREMDDLARQFGPEAADWLAACCRQWQRADFKHTGVLFDFGLIYLQHYPAAFVAGLFRQLDSAGPPLLVELLGEARQTGVSAELLSRIEFAQSDRDLKIALLGALGNLADEPARAYLSSLDLLGMDEELRREVESARISASRAN